MLDCIQSGWVFKTVIYIICQCRLLRAGCRGLDWFGKTKKIFTEFAYPRSEVSVESYFSQDSISALICLSSPYALHPVSQKFPKKLPLKQFDWMFVWLTMTLSRPFNEDRLALHLSTPLFSRWSMMQNLRQLIPVKLKIDSRIAWAGKDQIKAFSLSTSDYHIIRGYFQLQTEWYIKKSQRGRPRTGP